MINDKIVFDREVVNDVMSRKWHETKITFADSDILQLNDKYLNKNNYIWFLFCGTFCNALVNTVI